MNRISLNRDRLESIFGNEHISKWETRSRLSHRPEAAWGFRRGQTRQTGGMARSRPQVITRTSGATGSAQHWRRRRYGWSELFIGSPSSRPDVGYFFALGLLNFNRVQPGVQGELRELINSAALSHRGCWAWRAGLRGSSWWCRGRWSRTCTRPRRRCGCREVSTETYRWFFAHSWWSKRPVVGVGNKHAILSFKKVFKQVKLIQI